MEKNKKKVVANVVIKPPPAREYCTPQLNNIATKLKVDSPIYQPEKVGNCLALHASVPQAIRFAYRTTMKVDCGIDLEIPQGFVLKAVANDYFISKGLLISPAPVKSGRIVLTVVNIGKEIITINPQEVFALLYAEPAYFFDWSNS